MVTLIKIIRAVFKPSSSVWWRNYIVGPLSEEWVFRACICPLWISAHYSIASTILFSPLFFGAAHFHHMLQHLHEPPNKIKRALIEILFQLLYTSIFGAYSAFLFLRTGHLLSAFIAHSFCNFMGFPRIDIALEHPKRFLLLWAYASGLVGFLLLLYPLTEPQLFNNTLYSKYWN